MKAMLRQVLAELGLAPAGELRRLADQSRQSSDKVRSLEDRVAKLRADADTWKRRHEEMVTKRREELKDVAAEAEHAKVRTSEWKARAEALAEEKRELRARLEEVQRAAITAREYVMATEMKLDLIEAALQVLDSRTREAAISRA